MTRSQLYLSVRGRLSPTSFAKGLWPLAFVGITVFALTPTWRIVGYPLDHWAGLAYALMIAWPLFALTVKRLHDSGRSFALAIPAMIGLPAAEAGWLAFTYNAFSSVPSYFGIATSTFIYCAWGVLMWRTYRFPGLAL